MIKLTRDEIKLIAKGVSDIPTEFNIWLATIYKIAEKEIGGEDNMLYGEEPVGLREKR